VYKARQEIQRKLKKKGREKKEGKEQNKGKRIERTKGK
jgi:hypothetical protein